MSAILIETAAYMFATHRGGGASLTRKADNRSLYFQPGDDANQAIGEASDIAALGDDWFDHWAREYDMLFGN